LNDFGEYIVIGIDEHLNKLFYIYVYIVVKCWEFVLSLVCKTIETTKPEIGEQNLFN